MLWVWLMWAVGLTAAFQRPPLSNLDYQPNCQNDGFYLNNGTCSCKPYFTGDSCEKRTCMNGGHNYEYETDRCVCPPRFLGANCEPRACLGNVDAVFDPPTSRKNATFVFTWTPDMVKKIKESGDDFLEYIGTNFDSLGYSEMNFIVPDGATQMNVETPDDYNRFKNFFEDFVCDEEDGYCPIDNMPYNEILGAVRRSSPRSPIYIITNIKLDSAEKDTYFQQIIQEATMMGVTINTLLYGPPKINYFTVYSEPGFVEYGDLAAATGGFYMTPYDPAKNAPLGALGVTGSLEKVHKMITTTYPIHMDPSPDPETYHSENGILYFTFRSNNTTPPDFFLQVILPSNKRLDSTAFTVSDAGLSKIYMLDLNTAIAPNTKSIMAMLQTSSRGPVAGVRIYGQPAFPLDLGTSTAIQVDASHPHAVPTQGKPTGPDMLVSAGEGISFVKATNWHIIANDGSLKRRLGETCLFPSILGKIKSCDNQTSTWIQVQNSDESTGMIPFYCGDAYYKSSNPSNVFRDWKRSRERETPTIRDDPPRKASSGLSDLDEGSPSKLRRFETFGSKGMRSSMSGGRTRG